MSSGHVAVEAPPERWAGRFASFTYLRDLEERLSVQVSDWEASFAPDQARWDRRERGKPVPIGN
jgi:hypothetical protein